jgi:2-polyprenyl-3-methyl-5-hydroxy-6-metoxy-1,4-benzoquinol methylase
VAKIRLREKGTPPTLGTNLHMLQSSHQRITFVKENYRKGRILDAACGEGAFAKYLAAQPENVVMAVDILPAPGLENDPLILFRQVSVYDLDGLIGPFEFKFDTILFMEIIEHLEDPRKAIDILHNYLVPDGVMLISTPYISQWDNETDHIWRFEDIASVDELLEGLFHVTWKDNIFIYASIRKLK